MCQVPEYADNITAKNNGVPIWGWYRTGGILKIRLNDVPPVLTLLGNYNILINIGNYYTDPGVTAIDYYNNQLPVYITSIGINNSNILNNNILISGKTLITSTSLLSLGNYNITYTATDLFGNNNTINRIINISNQPVLSIPGLIFFTSPDTYNSTNNTWVDVINNTTVIPASNTLWNANGYFVVQNNNNTNPLTILNALGLINSMNTIFLVLSLPTDDSKVLIHPDISSQPAGSNSYFVAITSNNFYSDNSYNGAYTDTISNRGIINDQKFHVYLVTGLNWNRNDFTNLYFGGYLGNSFIFKTGTRIAAIGIYNRLLTTSEINTIQSWFNSQKFNG